MNADCAAFEHWLDEELPQGGAAAARAHAARCSRCAALLELEEALAAGAPAAAPADFTDAVMARVQALPAARPRTVASLFPVPVWVPALLDPLVALALTALALLVLGRDALLALGGSVASRWGAAEWPAFAWPSLELPRLAASGAASHALSGLSSSPLVATATLLALAPVVLLASWQLFRWTDRLVSGRWERGFAR